MLYHKYLSMLHRESNPDATRGTAPNPAIVGGSGIPERTDLRRWRASLHAFLTHLRDALCALQGHDDLPVFKPARVFLRCASCGRETHGWALDRPAPIPIPLAIVPLTKSSAARGIPSHGHHLAVDSAT